MRRRPARLCRATRGMGETAGKMKQFACWFTHGVAGGAKLRAAIYQARSGAEVLAQVDAFFTTLSSSQEAGLADAEEDASAFPQDVALVCD